MSDKSSSTDEQAVERTIATLLQQLEIQKKLQLSPDENQSKSKENHKFWKTQPVLDFGDSVEEEGAIEPSKELQEIRHVPYALSPEFEWILVNVDDTEELKEVYELLSNHYVEDADSLFRFDYSPEFLSWALKPPGWKKEWHLGVRVKKQDAKGKLVAFIAAIPAHMKIRKHDQLLVEINFLCVHKKLRQKRLAPVLIKEITRRVHLFDIFQAVYTAGLLLPKPIVSCRYWHRSLNAKKLVDVGFSAKPPGMDMQRYQLRFRLPSKPKLPIRPMEKRDVDQVLQLLNSSFEKDYDLCPIFSKQEVEHYFIPIENVVSSFVSEKNGKITDFVSYYNLSSSVLGGSPPTKVNDVKAAYLFYYVGEDVKVLINDALIMARDEGYDVFNCLELMQNQTFVEDLKFGKGDGTLHYYMYNYKAKDVDNTRMGLVMM